MFVACPVENLVSLYKALSVDSEVTGSISTHPRWDGSPFLTLNLPVAIYAPGWREPVESKLH